MARITYTDLPSIRETHKNKKIIFCSGVFDLTHAGHALFFDECKKYGDILVVVVGCDENIKKYKSGRPILNEEVRIKMVDSLKPVDYVLFDGPVPADNLNAYLEPLFAGLHPDVYVVNKDAFDLFYREEIAKKHKIQFVVLDRWCPPEFENISTTNIIEKIKKTI